jgi:hypothetical protein
VLKLPTEEVVYDDGAGVRVRLVVQQANYLQGLTRTLLIEQAFKEFSPEWTGSPVAQAETLIRGMAYPSMVAAVVEVDDGGLFSEWPPTATEFLSMPQQFGTDWEFATFRLNPGWRVGAKRPAPTEAEAEAELEKKDLGSSGP